MFFLGVALTSLGSAYYHLAPGNDRLVWDRLPMTFAFMSLLTAIVIERIGLKIGFRLFLPLVMFGVGTVTYWHLSELQGRGDLRFYVLAQAYPLLGIPLMMLLFPPRYSRSGDLLGVLGFYILAKLFERLDQPILDLGRAVRTHLETPRGSPERVLGAADAQSQVPFHRAALNRVVPRELFPFDTRYAVRGKSFGEQVANAERLWNKFRINDWAPGEPRTGGIESILGKIVLHTETD